MPPSKADHHRRVHSECHEVFSLSAPFSFFDFTEDKFGGCGSVRRIFSLARAGGATVLVLEHIPAKGMIAEENEDIKARFPAYTPGLLVRLSFWSGELIDGTLSDLSKFAGYAILKQDPIEPDYDGWHVFEAVFPKYDHPHNCIPRPQKYSVRILGEIYSVEGVLYCQQNGLNKACAQVALRSLLSRLLPEGDISYRKINSLAESVRPGFEWGKGLWTIQIREVVSQLGFRFNDVNYEASEPKTRKELPYQKYAYAGLESGGGALVGFKKTGHASAHIIPVYGHTFNKDTWVPDANLAYFQIGKHLSYIPSECWTSSFIAHDDNFGPNYCVPRLYISNKNVEYVMEIFRPGVMFSGVSAEAVSISILAAVLYSHKDDGNKWVRRLKEWVTTRNVILRSQAMKREEYINHLRNITDWDGHSEDKAICNLLNREIAEFVWVVEISTPHLFPANERKLGEIVLDATIEIDAAAGKTYESTFIFARLPGCYLFGGDIDAKGLPSFTPIDSKLKSHTSLIRI
jgi:hypothetical protein